jgi:hypothetical protein
MAHGASAMQQERDQLTVKRRGDEVAISPMAALGLHRRSGARQPVVGRVASPTWGPSSGPAREEETAVERAGDGVPWGEE